VKTRAILTDELKLRLYKRPVGALLARPGGGLPRWVGCGVSSFCVSRGRLEVRLTSSRTTVVGCGTRPRMILRSPKRPQVAASNETKTAWFKYYAGYSDAFVTDVFTGLQLAPGSTLVDPWNGAGTTTQIANERGIVCHGFDINPAMVIVARARLLGGGIKPSHTSLARHISRLARREPGTLASEPLAEWFGPSSAEALRSLELAITRLLVGDTEQARPLFVGSVSQLAAFFYVALFRTVRAFLDPFRCSNPTWIKAPAGPRNRIRPTLDSIHQEFLAQVAQMGQALGRLPASTNQRPVQVGLGDSTALPLEDGSIDNVVTSPPYCTRIDYAIATRPELAVLAMGADALSQLRRATMGSVLTTGAGAGALSSNPRWGRTCLRLLERIREHPSRASKTYYLNTHLLYFDKLFRSIEEIARIVRPAGTAVFVVQDSYYKNVHNDLQTVVNQMASEVGWTQSDRTDFKVTTTKAAMNTRHQKYRQNPSATESVLWFRKN
jgi:DNA modification methylase